jgi:hypothetical protein
MEKGESPFHSCPSIKFILNFSDVVDARAVKPDHQNIDPMLQIQCSLSAVTSLGTADKLILLIAVFCDFFRGMMLMCCDSTLLDKKYCIHSDFASLF